MCCRSSAEVVQGTEAVQSNTGSQFKPKRGEVVFWHNMSGLVGRQQDPGFHSG